MTETKEGTHSKEFIMEKPRKKVCPRCGRKLWFREFYKLKSGKYSTYCKECERQDRKEYYRRTKKVPDRVFVDEKTGRLMVHKGESVALHWSGAAIEKFKRLYPTTKNEDMAIEFGVSARTIIRKARELGLQKDAEWMKEKSRSGVKIAIILNRCLGNSGMIKKGEHKSPGTEFKRTIND